MEVGHPGGEGVCDQYSLRLMVMVGEAFHDGVMFAGFLGNRRQGWSGVRRDHPILWEAVLAGLVTHLKPCARCFGQKCQQSLASFFVSIWLLSKCIDST